ncbi:hypothetical protein J437_LFUL011181, partial [Ladona fulva]
MAFVRIEIPRRKIVDKMTYVYRCLLKCIVAPRGSSNERLSLYTPKIDGRGKDRSRPHACKEDVELAKKHIRLFSKYKSHYSLSHNLNRQYILSVSSAEEMRRLYVMYCNEAGTYPLKPHKYRNIFNNNFNIGFKIPRSDTCKVCDEAANILLKDQPLTHRLHLKHAELAYESLSDARKMAIEPTCNTSALPTPNIPTEVVFYLRQVWTYNFCVHICNSNDAFMCVWPEFTVGRGADEIGSCLLRVIPKIRGDMKKKLIVYSDSCAGKNKNFPIMSLWIYGLIM